MLIFLINNDLKKDFGEIGPPFLLIFCYKIYIKKIYAIVYRSR